MSPELDKKLCETYPKLFADRHGDCTKTAMCWGFDIGDGWYNLVNDLCKEIDDYCEKNPDIKYPVAFQVKEKFGCLRFYVDGGNDDIWKMLDKAEAKSMTICEECGEPGEPRDGGWVKTLCEKHHLERQERRAALMKTDAVFLAGPR